MADFPVDENNMYDGHDLLNSMETHRIRVLIDWIAAKYFKDPLKERHLGTFQDVFGKLEAILEEKLDHQFNKLSMLVKERTETVPDIVRVEHQTHTEFFINNISIRRYNELMERLLTRRLHLYKTKENEIRNK